MPSSNDGWELVDKYPSASPTVWNNPALHVHTDSPAGLSSRDLVPLSGNGLETMPFAESSRSYLCFLPSPPSCITCTEVLPQALLLAGPKLRQAGQSAELCCFFHPPPCFLELILHLPLPRSLLKCQHLSDGWQLWEGWPPSPNGAPSLSRWGRSRFTRARVHRALQPNARFDPGPIILNLAFLSAGLGWPGKVRDGD